jgi:hypothetical protein
VARIARYYDPTTAQFLTVDPKVATTLSPYGYVQGDPLNGTDPTGLDNCGLFAFFCDAVSTAAQATYSHVVKPALDVAAVVPYGVYYFSYEPAHFVTSVGCSLGAVGCVIANAIALPAVPFEAVGLGGDIAIDALSSVEPAKCQRGVAQEPRAFKREFERWRVRRKGARNKGSKSAWLTNKGTRATAVRRRVEYGRHFQSILKQMGPFL